MINKEIFEYCVIHGFNRQTYELVAEKNNITYLQVETYIRSYIKETATPEEKEIYHKFLKQNQLQRQEDQKKIYRQRYIIFHYLIKNNLSRISILRIANYFKIDIKEAQSSFDIYLRKHATEEEKDQVRKLKKHPSKIRNNKEFRASTLPQYRQWFNIILAYNFNPLIIEELISTNNLTEKEFDEIISIYYQTFATKQEQEQCKQSLTLKNKKTDLVIYDYLVYKEFLTESIFHVQKEYQLSYDEVIGIISKYYLSKNKSQIKEEVKARVKKLISK